MVRSKIGRRLFFLLLIVAILPLIFLGVRLNIGTESLLIYAFYSAFITMILALFLIKEIIGPIKKLKEGTLKLADGELDFRVSFPSDNEFSQLAQSFNDMASVLKEKQDELRATALENINLYMDLTNRYKDLTRIHEAGMALIGEFDLEMLYKTIAKWTVELIGAETIAIPMVEHDKSIKYAYAYGMLGSELMEISSHSGEGGVFGLCEWVIKNDQPILVEDVLKDEKVDGELAARMGVRTVLVVPFRSKGRPIGGLSAFNKKGGKPFDKHDLKLLTIFGNQAAVSLENAKHHSELKERIEELKRTQNQLIHSAKLAAIGELATNIAHEINNPLTGVLGYVTLMLGSPDTSPSQKEMLDIMEKETIRARTTVRNLLDFSTPKPLRKEKRDIHDALKNSIILIRKLLEIANINLIEDYVRDVPQVEIDMDQMKQVFLNLINNALHAMPGGGSLTLKTFYRRSENAIIVEIIDSGSGIPYENLKRVFDPFFTTKEGEGTGLGLSISYRIIEGHGGRIEVESELGKGSRFKVILPKAK